MTLGAGSIDVLVSADTAQASSSLSKFAADAEREMKRTERANASAQKAGDAYVASLQRQIDTFGMTGAEVQKFEAKLRGVSVAADPLIDRLKKMKDEQLAFNAAARSASGLGAGAEGIKSNTHAMEGFSFATAGAKRELLVLGHELSQGNYKRFAGSLLVLGERTGAAALLFSGMGLAALGAVAALGAFAVAVFKGDKEQEAFNKSLILTGNYAGITEGQFNALSKTLGTDTHLGIGKTREAMQALIATGEIGPTVLQPLTRAVVLYAKATGETEEVVAKDFAKMSDGVAKFALEHNKQLNFLSTAQYDYIKRLEEQGRKEEAEIVISKALSDHLSGVLAPSLGYLGRAIHAAGAAWDSFWDSAKGVGRGESLEDKLNAAKKNLDDIGRNGRTRAPDSEVASSSPRGGQRTYGDLRANGAALVSSIENQIKAEKGLAVATAKRAAEQKAGNAASDFLDGINKKIKGTDRLREAMDKLHREQNIYRHQGGTITAAQVALQEAETRKEFGTKAPKGGPKLKPGDPEDLALQSIQKSIESEASLYAMRDKMLSAYHSNRIIDDATYYAGRQVAQDLYLDKTKAGYAQEFALIQKRMTSAKDGADRIKYQKQLVDLQEKYNKLLEGIAASGAIDALKRIGDATKEAEKETKAITDALKKKIDTQQKSVDADQKAINQQGMTKRQIEALTIAQLQDATAVNEQTLAKRSKEGASDKEIEQLNKLIELDRAGIDLKKKQLAMSNDFANGAKTAFNKYGDSAAESSAFAEKAVGGSLSRLEDAIVNFAKTGKLNLGSLFQFMADEFIRQQARMLIAKATGSDKGAGGGSGGIFGALLGLFGGGSSELTTSQYSTSGFATGTNSNYGHEGGVKMALGTNYVPYDGMPAVLHKGEAVVPAAFNPANGASTGHRYDFSISGQVINVGQGVSRGEVAAAVQQGNAANEIRIRRLLRNGNI